MLKKDDILAAEDLTYEDIEVPEWGGSVRIKTMTGTERDAFEAEIYQTQGGTIEFNRVNFRAKLLVKALADEENKRLFTDKDVERLGAKSIKPLERLFTVAQRLNALTTADVEELTKNLEEGREDSISS